MRLLLDTHTFLWWVTNSPRLSAGAASVVGAGANEVFVSVVTAWEIAIKKRLDRLVYPDDLSGYTRSQLRENGFDVLPLELDHALAVYDLPVDVGHKDLFDRMLVAQARVEGLAIVSADGVLDVYGVERVW